MAKNKNEKAIESGPLERLYNGIAPAKILDFLTLFQDYDYSKADIAKNSGVSFRHALREIGKLEQLGLIKQTRTVGRAEMYKLNTENPASRFLQKFALELAAQECQKIADKEIANEEQAKQPKVETIQA